MKIEVLVTFGSPKIRWGLALRAIFNRYGLSRRFCNVYDRSKAILFYSPAAKCDISWVEKIGGNFSHFWSVLWCLSVVWLFLLSSPSCNTIVSDSERESFQKIRGEKFKLGSGLTRDVKNYKNLSKIVYLHI